ncbi:MAG TPA: YciI family protein [Gemmatimonadaceae bacterium]|nr:YciI family protein [Gemmatimonadaceae bacterium]
MKYALMYEATPDFLTKVPAHIAAHRALWRVFHADGRLLMIGPFADEPAGGAMGIFSTRAAAEQFVREDPFVANGIVAHWTIREWNEVLVPDR